MTDAPRPTVRTATADDLDDLREVYRRSSLSNENDRANLLGSPDSLVWPGDGIATGRTRVAVDAHDTILGFATTVPIDGGLELDDLFTDPGVMRRGIATALIQSIVTETVREGAPWIEVTANPHAADFYAAAGFTRVGEAQTLFGSAPRLRLVVAP